jgi:hypothetical protein
MRKFWVSILIIMVLAFGQSVCAQLQWRETNREITARSLTDPRLTDGIEIYGSNGVITIRTQRRIPPPQVRVFTILGQLVSQATLNPGTSELRINSRGIYLLRIGNLTQKVAL